MGISLTESSTQFFSKEKYCKNISQNDDGF